MQKKNLNQVILKTNFFVCTYQDVLNTLRALKEHLNLLFTTPEKIAELFDVYMLSSDTLLTGYYEPWLEASYVKQGDFKYPIYKTPPDLKVVDLGQFHPRFAGQKLYYRLVKNGIKPYYSRKEIELGALAHKHLEIAWVKDKIKLFFLHIQGSGRLIFPDGKVKHVLYADKNGRQYVSLGNVLVKRGFLSQDQVNLDTISQVLKQHPDLMDELMWSNPSYVFFRLSDRGPFGSIGKPLTPWISVASDKNFLPFGSVALAQGSLPLPDNKKQTFVSLFLAQDTGGAIQGEHIDLFCGSDKKAKFIAGHLKNKIKLYLILRKYE
ncbi:MAG: MltA domain-containing protein [Desulfonauticus sp.]|nr:MltA domain-containing protein [Desulfonauticus sp.]